MSNATDNVHILQVQGDISTTGKAFKSNFSEDIVAAPTIISSSLKSQQRYQSPT